MQRTIEFENAHGISRRTYSRVSTYIVKHYGRERVDCVWFAEDSAEFALVDGTKQTVRYEDMGTSAPQTLAQEK